MKTIHLHSNGHSWVELRREGKRFLVKQYDSRRITGMKWFRRFDSATTFFAEALAEFGDAFAANFHSEKKGGENK